MKYIAALLTSLVGTTAFAQTGVYVPQMAKCDTEFNQLLSTYDIPGGTFALSKNGKLIYSRGFGYADIQNTETTKPHHLMRIASISKSITSIAIMTMVESGQLSLADKVFGANGVFANNSYFNSAGVTDSRIYDITIKHLLEHSGGWDRDKACVANDATPYPWSFSHCDPIAFPLHVTRTLGETNPVSERALVKFLMQKGLEFNPGSDYAYSNIGYLTLGLVIEEVSGSSYEQYVKTNILDPLGINDMHMANNLLIDKQEREAEYIGSGNTTLSLYGTGSYTPWEYGGLSVEAMDAHGGWIASARDLVRLLGAVDQFSTAPDILSSPSITSMTTPGVNSNYAKGWSVNSANNWWHSGMLPGTRSMWVRASSGYNWAILLNRRQVGSLSNRLGSAVDQLGWSCLTQASGFPNHDLFAVPTYNSSGLSISQGVGKSLDINWTSGDGDSRILIASENTPVTAFPTNGTDYTANASYGSGDQIGNGQYVVYNGSGNSVNVFSLDVGKTYHFRLIDYTKNATGGFHSLYQPAGYAQGSSLVSDNPFCNRDTFAVDSSNNETPTSVDEVIISASGLGILVVTGGNSITCGSGGDDDINGGQISPQTNSPVGFGVSPNPQYSWSAVSGATNYNIEVRKAGSGSPLFYKSIAASEASCPSGTGECVFSKPDVPMSGINEWRVRWQSSVATSPWSNWAEFMVGTVSGIPVIFTIPETPATLWPAGSGVSASPRYKWSPVTGATDYSLEVRENGSRVLMYKSLKATEAGCAAETTDCTFRKPDIPLTGANEWRVRSHNVNGTSRWSDWRNFIVGTASNPTTIPLVPATLWPAGSRVSASPQYKWSSVTSATDYSLEVRENGSRVLLYKSLKATEAGCAAETTDCTFRKPDLPLTGAYEWRVRSQNAAGTSQWSNWRDFSTRR